MLEYFNEKGLVYYPSETPDTWEEAIRLSCQKLEENDYISESYIDEIIQSINTHGPYIVIMPNVAMPHAGGNDFSVFKSGISFTKFKTPIVFHDEKANEDKPALLFFTLAAKNADEHLQNIMNLTDLFSDEALIESLMASETMEDFTRLMEANKSTQEE